MSTHREEIYRITGLPVPTDLNNPRIVSILSRLSARRICGFLPSITASAISSTLRCAGRFVGPAPLCPLNRRNTDRILGSFLFIQVNAEAGLVIRPQETLV